MLLTIVICTHNPRTDFLERTLDSLQRQTLPHSKWEVLLIDNASTEPVKDRFDLSWHPRSRHIREDTVGLTAARVRGIQESKGKVIVFIDDDNVLDERYLEHAVAIHRDIPHLGCFGAGVLAPEFEELPAPDLMRHTDMLALRIVSNDIVSTQPSNATVPWGAGMVVTRPVAEAFMTRCTETNLNAQLGRRGALLNSGEDDEFSWIAYEQGRACGLFPRLAITHLIDKRRVQLPYLLRLAEGHAYSHTILAWLHGLPLPEPAHVNPSLWDVVAAMFSLRRATFLWYKRVFLENLHDNRASRAIYAARAAGIRRGRAAVSAIKQGLSDNLAVGLQPERS